MEKTTLWYPPMQTSNDPRDKKSRKEILQKFWVVNGVEKKAILRYLAACAQGAQSHFEPPNF